MKNFFCTLLALSSLLSTTRADTIDYWHVYYNGIKIKAYSEFDKVKEITIALEGIADGDSITVVYCRDVFCTRCPTMLMLEDENHQFITIGRSTGTCNPISFALKDLVAMQKNDGHNRCAIFYGAEQWNMKIGKRLIFNLQIE